MANQGALPPIGLPASPPKKQWVTVLLVVRARGSLLLESAQAEHTTCHTGCRTAAAGPPAASLPDPAYSTTSHVLESTSKRGFCGYWVWHSCAAQGSWPPSAPLVPVCLLWHHGGHSILGALLVQACTASLYCFLCSVVIVATAATSADALASAERHQAGNRPNKRRHCPNPSLSLSLSLSLTLSLLPPCPHPFPSTGLLCY
jgi:hypothetical protein